MQELVMIKYLLKEIEEEQEYNADYKRAEGVAKREVAKSGRWYWEYIDTQRFNRSPRKSVIQANARMIRRLLRKLY